MGLLKSVIAMIIIAFVVVKGGFQISDDTTILILAIIMCGMIAYNENSA